MSLKRQLLLASLLMLLVPWAGLRFVLELDSALRQQALQQLQAQGARLADVAGDRLLDTPVATAQGAIYAGSTDQAITGIAGIMTLLLCAALFKLLPIYDAFFWQYLYAFVGVFLTVFFLSRVPDPPKPKSTSLGTIVLETPKLCLQRSPFRQYLAFMIAAALMGPAFVPLKAYYLKVGVGLGAGTILLYTALQYCGAIIGTLFMRSRVDTWGAKPVFRIALVLNAAVSIYWFLLVSGHSVLLHFLPVAYTTFGLGASLWLTSHLKYLPRVCDEEKQALHVSVHSSVVGIIGGLAPIFWGFTVKLPGGQPGVREDTFSYYFLALLAMQLILFLYIPRLTSEHRERPSLYTTAGLLRPFRFVGQLVNLTPSGQGKSGRK